MSAQFLFHRPTLWSSNIQCSTKVLARSFAARGYKSTYLHNAVDPVHLIKRSTFVDEWRSLPRQDDDVQVAMQFSMIPTRDIWPLNTKAAASLRYRLSIPQTAAVGAPDVVWTTIPGTVAPLKRAFPKAKIVFHVIDYYPAFRGDAVKVLERADYAAADQIFVIGESLRDYLVNDLSVPDDQIVVLGQGVATGMYQGDLAEPEDIKDLSGPRAIWCGVLDKCDPGLFRRVAEIMREHSGSLVMIGPDAEWTDAFRDEFAGVVHFLGSKDGRELPAYLVHSDIGLMLYDRERAEVYRGQNPLKLYEYAAAGLPILSTPHDVYASVKPPAAIVRDEAQTEEALRKVLANHGAYREAAIAFAQEHSWDKKIDTILAKLGLLR